MEGWDRGGVGGGNMKQWHLFLSQHFNKCGYVTIKQKSVYMDVDR